MKSPRYSCFPDIGLLHRARNFSSALFQYTPIIHSPRAAPRSMVNTFTIGETKTHVSGLYSLFPSKSRSLSNWLSFQFCCTIQFLKLVNVSQSSETVQSA